MVALLIYTCYSNFYLGRSDDMREATYANQNSSLLVERHLRVIYEVV